MILRNIQKGKLTSSSVILYCMLIKWRTKLEKNNIFAASVGCLASQKCRPTRWGKESWHLSQALYALIHLQNYKNFNFCRTCFLFTAFSNADLKFSILRNTSFRLRENGDSLFLYSTLMVSSDPLRSQTYPRAIVCEMSAGSFAFLGECGSHLIINAKTGSRVLRQTLFRQK